MGERGDLVELIEQLGDVVDEMSEAQPENPFLEELQQLWADFAYLVPKTAVFWSGK